MVGEVVLPMEGEGNDIAPSGAQGRTAISLMHIEIDDQYLFTAPLVEAGLRGNHQIVEQTKTAAVIPMGEAAADHSETEIKPIGQMSGHEAAALFQRDPQAFRRAAGFTE